MIEKKNQIKYILIKIIYILIMPIIIYDICLISQTIINPENTPSIFGYKTFSIVSGSMAPNININDIIIVKYVEKDNINVGDIITYKTENDIITHRVIGIENADGTIIYTTKGDNNEVTDIEKVSENDLEGKYIGKIPRIGAILSFIKNKIVFGIIIIILIISYLYERNRFSNKLKRKEKRIKWENEQKKYGNN